MEDLIDDDIKDDKQKKKSNIIDDFEDLGDLNMMSNDEPPKKQIKEKNFYDVDDMDDALVQDSKEVKLDNKAKAVEDDGFDNMDDLYFDESPKKAPSKKKAFGIDDFEDLEDINGNTP